MIQPAFNGTFPDMNKQAYYARIAAKPLKLPDGRDYINDRMALSGTSPHIFDESAVTTAYGSCNASLRQLNLILTKALTIGAQNQKQNIDSDIVLAAVNDISLA